MCHRLCDPILTSIHRVQFAVMDVLFFLKLRTDFLRRFYKQALFPFLEAKRKIREHEEPFNDPPFDDSGDPPYLKEWEEADEAIEVLGQACVSFLSGSLKLFLNESEQEFRKFYGPLPEKDASTFKRHGSVTGYQHWFASVGINMEDSRVDINVISEIVYTRHMAEHHNSIGSMQLPQDESARKKFPVHSSRIRSKTGSSPAA
jgi:hypothetical protein